MSRAARASARCAAEEHRNMNRVSVVVAVVVIGSMVVGCQQDRHDPNDVPVYQATGNYDRSSSSAPSSSSRDHDPSINDKWLVQARAVDIRPSMERLGVRELP